MTDVTILSDNTVGVMRPVGLLAEWGFAAAVDDVLFDTGLTGAAFSNAVRLGMDPKRFESIVLSHGHHDHTGGIEEFLLDDPTVYAHPGVWEPRYKDGVHNGMPFTRDRVADGATIVEHREPTEVAPGIWALGEIPREYPDNPSGQRPVDGSLTEDHVPDDQALAVVGEAGVTVILGCCHSGLRNTIEYAEQVVDAPVTQLIGGTHLVDADADGLREMGAWLRSKGSLEAIAPCHCTGFQAESILSTEVGDKFSSIGVGSTLSC